jgi:predicted small secreted protein
MLASIRLRMLLVFVLVVVLPLLLTACGGHKGGY